VLAAEQSSNNDDKGDVESTIQVLAELKKQQREAPFKAPQIFERGRSPSTGSTVNELEGASSPATRQTVKQNAVQQQWLNTQVWEDGSAEGG
jgi:hypothetical protein